MAVHKRSKTLDLQFDSKKAQQILSKNNLAHQRKVDPKHVQHIVELIKISDSGGTPVRAFSIALAYVEINGQMKCLQINGQHSCHSIIQTGTTVEALIEEWFCDYVHDLGDAYTIYDTDEKTRNIDQLILVHRDTLQLNWTNQATLLTLKAAWALDPNSKNLKKSDKIAMIKNLINEGIFVNNIFSGLDKSHITRKTIVVNMLRLWRINRNSSQQFWEDVRDGAMLSNDDPTKVLRDWLKDINWVQGHAFISGKKIDRREIRCKITYAWNKFIKDQKISKLIYQPSRPDPQPIGI